MLTLERVLERLVDGVGRAARWLLLALMAVIVFDVVTRRFVAIGSAPLQELEWHLHTALFTLALAYVLTTDGHVRIELLRQRMAARTRAWIEVVGFVAFLLPFTTVTLYYGVDFALTAYLQGESSPSPTGLPHRWIIKAFMPLGMALLLLAGIAVTLRNVWVLMAPERAADRGEHC